MLKLVGHGESSALRSFNNMIYGKYYAINKKTILASSLYKDRCEMWVLGGFSFFLAKIYDT